MTHVERAQPWLGTLVSIRVSSMHGSGTDESAGPRALEAAFRAVAQVHRLMSFHDPLSDVGRINRAPLDEPVGVHAWTWEVLQHAARVYAASDGCFDVSVGGELVEMGVLPRPGAARGSRRGSFGDVELLTGHRVVAHRPVCIDLGGVAKGYAVDRAVASLLACGVQGAVVNAGGDIRVLGPVAERIRLAAPAHGGMSPVLELADGSAAGSAQPLNGARLHLDGRTRQPAVAARFACVVAPQCVLADALTKVVLARGSESAAVLRRFGGLAYLWNGHGTWERAGKEAE